MEWFAVWGLRFGVCGRGAHDVQMRIVRRKAKTAESEGLGRIQAVAHDTQIQIVRQVVRVRKRWHESNGE